MADGFLGRWSQRKQAVREGKPLEEPPATPAHPSVTSAPPGPARLAPAPGSAEPAAHAPPVVSEQAPPLSLEDAAALGAESDYAPFVARSVAPEVRNAAMKKLFTDPHYNLMDRLDTYIDDYSLPDPLPESMLRQMASAKFLKLFDEEPQAPSPATGDSADTPATRTVAQSPHTEIQPGAAPDAAPVLPGPPPEPEDDHTDLRLQPNHAAGREPSGRGTQ